MVLWNHSSVVMSGFLSSLIIRGDKDEHAVLCSEDKTRPICCCLSLDVNLQISRSQHLLSSCMHRSLEKSFLKMWVYPLLMWFCPLITYFSDLGVFKLLLGAEKTETKVKEVEETSDGESVWWSSGGYAGGGAGTEGMPLLFRSS